MLLYETRRAIRSSEASVPTVTETTMLPQAGAQLAVLRDRLLQRRDDGSGVGVRTGIAAADPALLPVGTVVRSTHQTLVTAASGP